MKKNTLKKSLVLMLCTTILLGTMVGCSKKNIDTSGEKGNVGTTSNNETNNSKGGNYKKEIIIGLANTFTVADPQATASITNTTLYKITHSTLIEWDYDMNDYVCDLAESYEIVDPQTYIFHLNQNAYFHNGEPVTAEDIIYTFKRAEDSSYTSAKVAVIKEMNAIDSNTIEFKLTGPSTNFLFDLASPNMSILSKAAMDELGDSGTMIGSGAYYYESIDFGNETNLFRFDKYFGEMPKTEKLTFRQYGEDATRVIALQTGEIDYCQTPSTLDLDYIAQDDNLDLIQMDGTRLNYLVLNVSKEPFNNELVRQAMNYAVNKDDVLYAAGNGQGSVWQSFVTPIGYGYSPVDGYNYNVEKAKELLAQAGYADGFEFSVLAHDSTSRAIVPILQAQYAEIGIKMNISEVETALRNSMIKNNEHEACMAAHVSDVSADSNMRILWYTGFANNRMQYSNARVDELLDSALIEQDEAKRLEMYKEIQEITVEDAACVPLYVETQNIAKKKSLNGIKINATGCHDFTYAYILE